MSRLVRVDRLREEGLSDGKVIDALVTALNGIGIVMQLQRLHGGRAPQVYAGMGGLIRFDADGNVLVPVPDRDDGDDDPTVAEVLQEIREAERR